MTILCYHAVNPTWSSPLSMTPQAFAAQCAWMVRHRQVLPLDQAVERLGAGGGLPRGTAALTFDDGFASVYEHAWPVLVRHGLPATVFLVAQTLTEAGQQVDWIRTSPPWESRTLDVEQVREMQQAGVGFASHSWSHTDLPKLSYAECLADLRASRELLESVLGHPVRLLAYPRGLHAAHVRQAARDAGYSHAFTLPEAPEQVGRYAVPRVGLYRGNGVGALRVKSAPGYLTLRHHRTTTAARRAVRLLAGARR